MAIKDLKDYLFYEEEPSTDKERAKTELIGIFRSPFSDEIRSYKRLSFWKRFFAIKPRPPEHILDDAQFVAAARIARSGGLLYVRNVAAIESFGPTMYATILEIAKVEGLKGVVPTQDNTKMVPKVREIWRRFAKYPQVQLTQMQGCPNINQWLGHQFALKTGESLITLDDMRSTFNCYVAEFSEDQGRYLNGALRDAVFELLKESVEAHR